MKKFISVLILLSVLTAPVHSLSWTQYPNAAWSPSYADEEAVVLNNKMYVIIYLGYVGSGHNEVWSSADGTSWIPVNTYVLPNNVLRDPFVYNRKICASWSWGGNYLQCSSDGNTWTQQVGNMPYYHAGPVVLANKLWIFDSEGPNQGMVWSSADGTSWTQVTNSAPWGGGGTDSEGEPIPRGGFTVAVYNRNMWIVGGCCYDTGVFSYGDAWRSPDGINWIQVSGMLPPRVVPHYETAVFNNRLWLLGGDDYPTYSNTIHSTSDNGASWIFDGNAPWSKRPREGKAVYQRQLWILGGESEPDGVKKNDIWSAQ